MFGIGGFEFIIILIFGFLLLGDRLPDVAKTLTRALRTFQTAQKDMNEVIRNDVFDPNADEPFKDPLAALDKMGDVAKRAGSSLAGDFKEAAAQAKKKPGEAASSGAASGTSASASANAAAASATPAAAEAPKPAETFAERRARYERERAARLAAEAEAAAAAAAAENAEPEAANEEGEE